MLYHIILQLIFFVSLGLFSCSSQSQHKAKSLTPLQHMAVNQRQLLCLEFRRDTIIAGLNNKIKNGDALIVHIFVPLCDNDNQGIIPTSKSLGNGLNLKTNLYWGAGYGIKTHFKRKKDWKLVYQQYNTDSNILERVVFFKVFSNHAKVYLIADGYRGDRMEQCLDDYLNSLVGTKKDLLNIENKQIGINSHSDLLIFNGHNGLMDVDMDLIYNEDGIFRDAAVISCVSYDYFANHLKCLKAYPLVTSVSFLPPEAYVAEGIINSWALMKTNEEIRLAAGDAMYRVHKKSRKAMRAMFKTGW